MTSLHFNVILACIQITKESGSHPQISNSVMPDNFHYLEMLTADPGTPLWESLLKKKKKKGIQMMEVKMIKMRAVRNA